MKSVLDKKWVNATDRQESGIQKQLRESQDWLQAIFEASRDGIMVEEEERIVYVNPAYLKLLGYDSAEELIGKHLSFVIAPEDNTRMLEYGKRRMKGEPAPPLYEFKARRQDKTLIELEGSISTAWAGNQFYIVSMVRDIGERKKAEQALREREEQLRQSQKMEAVGKLAGGVAHDFNNLLTAIMGYSELLLSSIPPHNPLRGDVEEIKRAGNRAAELTRQLLAFSRKQLLQPQILDLNEVVLDMGKMLRRLIGADIELVTLHDPDRSLIKGDRGQIEQVILNLSLNARDAMTQGGKLTLKTANVEFDESSARRYLTIKPGRYAMLSVTDTGCGMDTETQSHIFEPFYTTKKQGEGTGLGLSMVYGIIEQSGGSVRVESELFRGTTFKIYLPQAVSVSKPVMYRDEGIETPGGSETILLAEDEGVVRNLAYQILSRNGYRVLEAPNGTDALRTAIQHLGPIQLLVTDLVMPLMGGRDLAKRLRSLRPKTKVLYMSGYPDDSMFLNGGLDPCASIIQKPFSPDSFARKVREVLDGEKAVARGQ